MDAQKFCLKWDGFQGSVTSVFDHLRQDSELVDVTLCCDGHRVRAHRMMLSACSPYFRELFKDLTCQQLVIFLKDTSASDLTAIVEFMYKGSVNVAQSQLASFIKTAEMLQVQGLSGGDDKEPPPSPAPPPPPERQTRSWTQSQQPASPAPRLRRVSETAAEPAEPRLKRRRAEPPPQVERRSSPPPAPAVPLGGLPESDDMGQDQAVGQFENPVKVEKFDVDLTLDDDEAAGGEELDSALGLVAHYDPGSDQSLSADGQLFGAVAEAGADGTLSGNVGPGGPYTPGPSQRAGEDGAQADGEIASCPVCGVTYYHRRTLREHMKRHSGETRCPVCYQEFGMKNSVRRHMVIKHGMSKEAVDRLTNRRLRTMEYMARFAEGQEAATEPAPPYTGYGAPSQRDAF